MSQKIVHIRHETNANNHLDKIKPDHAAKKNKVKEKYNSNEYYFYNLVTNEFDDKIKTLNSESINNATEGIMSSGQACNDFYCDIYQPIEDCLSNEQPLPVSFFFKLNGIYHCNVVLSNSTSNKLNIMLGLPDQILGQLKKHHKKTENVLRKKLQKNINLSFRRIDSI